MDNTKRDYLSAQLDKTRAAADSARSAWSQQWLANLEARLIRDLQMASVPNTVVKGQR